MERREIIGILIIFGVIAFLLLGTETIPPDDNGTTTTTTPTGTVTTTPTTEPFVDPGGDNGDSGAGVGVNSGWVDEDGNIHWLSGIGVPLDVYFEGTLEGPVSDVFVEPVLSLSSSEVDYVKVYYDMAVYSYGGSTTDDWSTMKTESEIDQFISDSKVITEYNGETSLGNYTVQDISQSFGTWISLEEYLKDMLCHFTGASKASTNWHDAHFQLGLEIRGLYAEYRYVGQDYNEYYYPEIDYMIKNFEFVIQEDSDTTTVTGLLSGVGLYLTSGWEIEASPYSIAFLGGLAALVCLFLYVKFVKTKGGKHTK